MGKVIGKIIIFIVPILFVIGLFRVAVHGGDPSAFLPTWPEFVGYMSSAPDAYGMISEPINIFNASVDTLSNFQVTDIGSFFGAIGSFFTMIGNAFAVAWAVIEVPFKYVGWFVSFIAGFAG